MLRRTERYVRHTHPHKSRPWPKRRYWGKLNPERNDHWVLGDQRTGRYLLKFSWFKIVRHTMVRGPASAADPGLREYWWERQKVNARYLSASDWERAIAQD